MNTIKYRNKTQYKMVRRNDVTTHSTLSFFNVKTGKSGTFYGSSLSIQQCLQIHYNYKHDSVMFYEYFTVYDKSCYGEKLFAAE